MNTFSNQLLQKIPYNLKYCDFPSNALLLMYYVVQQGLQILNILFRKKYIFNFRINRNNKKPEIPTQIPLTTFLEK